MRLLLTLACFLLSFSSFAQKDTSATHVELDTARIGRDPVVLPVAALPKSVIGEGFRKNIVKLNLSSLALYNNSLSYERALSRKTSFVVGYRYMPQTTATSALLVRKATEDLQGEDADLRQELYATTVGNNAFTGEIRFYAGKKPGPRGFYLSLYGRYMSVRASYPYEYETDTRIYTLPLEGKLSGFAAGVMIGSQWLISKRVAFDWYILGGHYGKLKIDGQAESDLRSMSAKEKIDLQRDLESIGGDLPLRPHQKVTVTDQGARITGSAPFIGLRSLGFNLGVAF